MNAMVRNSYIRCWECGKLILAEKTNNGLADCWLGHCCGFGQAEYDYDAVEWLTDDEMIANAEAHGRRSHTVQPLVGGFDRKEND